MIDDKVVIETYQETRSILETGKRFGRSNWWVANILNRNGIGRFSREKYDREQIRKLWEETHDLDHIVDTLDIPHTFLRQILRRELDIKVPVFYPNKYVLPMDELAQRYQNGETCGEIARSIGIPSERIRRRLTKYGVKIRSAAVSVPRGKKNIWYKDGKHSERGDTVHYFRRQSYEVAAICFGQPLPQGWVIHHLDENPLNNNPDNLLVFPDKADHARYHTRLLRLLQLGKQVDATQLALETGAQRLPQPPHPIELLPYTKKRGPSGLRGEQPFVQEGFEL